MTNLKDYFMSEIALVITILLYKKYTYLKSKELEELTRFGVMSW